MPDQVWDWAGGKRDVFRAKRVGLWRRHGEVTRTLLVMAGFVRRPGSTVVVLQGLAHFPPPALHPAGIRASIT